MCRRFLSIWNSYLKNFSGLPPLAWKGLFTNFVVSVLFGIGGFLSLYFVNQLKFSIVAAGEFLACYGIGSVIGAFAAGKLADIYSPGKVAILSVVLQAIGYFCLGFNHNYVLLVSNMSLLGFGNYAFLTANTLWILAKCHESSVQRLKALNILSAISNLGQGIAAIFISFLAIQNFTALFSVTSLALLGLAIFLQRIETNIKGEIINDNIVKVAPTFTFSKNVIFYVLFSLFFGGLIISQLCSTYPIFLENRFHTMGLQSFSILFMINTFFVVFFQEAIVSGLHRFNKIWLIGISLLCLGSAFLILNYGYSYIYAIFSVILLTLGEMVFFSLSQSVCYENTALNKKGNALGVYRAIFAMSRIAGPIFGSYILQYYGAASLWLICFIMSLTIAAPAIFFYQARITLTTVHT